MCSTFITRLFTLLPTFASLVSQVDITCFTFRTFSFCHLYFHTFSFSPAKTCTDWNGNQVPSETWKPLWSPQVGGRGSTDAKKPGAGSKPLRRIVSAGCFSCSPKKTEIFTMKLRCINPRKHLEISTWRIHVNLDWGCPIIFRQTRKIVKMHGRSKNNMIFYSPTTIGIMGGI